jgi:hypothetical protein
MDRAIPSVAPTDPFARTDRSFRSRQPIYSVALTDLFG